jgi:hypothetical protein
MMLDLGYQNTKMFNIKEACNLNLWYPLLANQTCKVYFQSYSKMFNFSYFVFFSLLIWILAVEATPPTVYRGDTRIPQKIKDKGGFTTRAHDNNREPKGTLLEHVEGGQGPRTGFISTSADHGAAKARNKDGYVYHLDTQGGKYHDVAAAYQAQGKSYGHSKEKEHAHEGNIPWSSVKGWDKVKNGDITGGHTTRQSFDNPPQRPASPQGPAPGRKASKIPRPAKIPAGYPKRPA